MKQSRFLSRTDQDGVQTRMPLMEIKGARDGEQITIFGGQHGTEYAGIEACLRLCRDLDPQQLTGTVRVVAPANLHSFENWIQFAPTTPPMKEMMLEAATGSQYIINCHGGEFSEGMHPYVICRLISEDEADKTARRMATAFGVGIVSLSRYRGEPPPDPSGARPAWWLWPKKGLCDELGIPEITPEVGEKTDRNDSIVYEGILNVLRELDFLSEEPRQAPELKVIGERWWLTADQQGVFYPSCQVGQDVQKGAGLGEVRDYFGKVLQRVEAPDEGRVMNLNVGMPVRKDGFLVWLGQLDGSWPEETDNE